MTAALLLLLNAQVALVMVYVIREWRGASRYRKEALELVGGQLDVHLLTAAKTGIIRRRNGKRPVIAVLGDEKQAERQAEHAEVSHGS